MIVDSKGLLDDGILKFLLYVVRSESILEFNNEIECNFAEMLVTLGMILLVANFRRNQCFVDHDKTKAAEYLYVEQIEISRVVLFRF